VIGGVSAVIGVLIAIASDGTLGMVVRWLAGVGIVVALGIPAYVVWRMYLRSGRGTHGRPDSGS
jgi:Flp pilus assembly protein TadB